jgi:hypothetical protein
MLRSSRRGTQRSIGNRVDVAKGLLVLVYIDKSNPLIKYDGKCHDVERLLSGIRFEHPAGSAREIPARPIPVAPSLCLDSSWSLSIIARIRASASSFYTRCVRATSSAACTLSIPCGPGLRHVVGRGRWGSWCRRGHVSGGKRELHEICFCAQVVRRKGSEWVGTTAGKRGDMGSMLSSVAISSSSGCALER